jgi:hypothetical protein
VWGKILNLGIELLTGVIARSIEPGEGDVAISISIEIDKSSM